jgi:hypothetical protein
VRVSLGAHEPRYPQHSTQDLSCPQCGPSDGRAEKEILRLNLIKSRAATYDYLPRNPETISEFFGRYMK